MKRIKLFFVSAFIAVSAVLFAGDIYFVDTGGMARFISLDVSGSDGFLYTFKKKTVAHIEGTFYAPLIIDQLDLDCNLEIQGVPIPIVISSKPHTSYLPAYIGDKITFYLDIPIHNSLPTIQAIFHVEVRDGYKNLIAGAKFPVMIVN